MRPCRLLLLLLLSGGLALPSCDRALQDTYCKAWYGGDYHTACQYCGRGAACPPGAVTGRVIQQPSIREEILRRHNEYRRDVRRGKVGGMPETKEACLPPLAWDSELAEVAQVWADQCSMISYPSMGATGFPRVFHEKSSQRSTSRFNHPPGVGQNVAWALTQDINFTQIIDDLWYRDIRSLKPGVMDDFRVSGASNPASSVITQMLWGHTTHIGCGWAQIDVGDNRYDYPGRYENFFVCNYGVGGNIPGQPVYRHPDCQTHLDVNSSVAVGGINAPSVIKENSSSQVFPNFSVGTRTVIAACLQAIQCQKSDSTGTSQCNDLSEICHTKGPHPIPTTPLMRVLDLECRVEHILCHAMSSSPTATCQENFHKCRLATPDSSPLSDNKGVTEVMAMMGLGVPQGQGQANTAIPTATNNAISSTFTTAIPPTSPAPPQSITPPPTVTSSSLDDLTTIGSDFKLTTSPPGVGFLDPSDASSVTEAQKEFSVAADVPTSFTSQSQPSASTNSMELTTLPGETDSSPDQISSVTYPANRLETTSESNHMVQSTERTAESIEKSETTTENYLDIYPTTSLTLNENARELTTEYTKDLSTEYANNTARPTSDLGITLGPGEEEKATSLPYLSGVTDTRERLDANEPRPTGEEAQREIATKVPETTKIGHTSTQPFNLEDLSSVLQNELINSLANSSLLLTPEDLALGAISGNLGNDTLFILQDILVDSTGRVINQTTNLGDDMLFNSIDPSIRRALEKLLESPKNLTEEFKDRLNGHDNEIGQIDQHPIVSHSSTGPEMADSEKAIKTISLDMTEKPIKDSGTQRGPSSFSVAYPTFTETSNGAETTTRVSLDKGNSQKGVTLGQPLDDLGDASEDPALQIGANSESVNTLSEPVKESHIEKEMPQSDPESTEVNTATTPRKENDIGSASQGTQTPTTQGGGANQPESQEDAENYSTKEVNSATPTSNLTTDKFTTTSPQAHISTQPDVISRKVEDGETKVFYPSLVPGIQGEQEVEKELEQKCLRHYTESGRQVDISYYNTTVRTRLLTAICLEGIRCDPSQDSTRCNILHSRCNKHVDTTELSFSMRVTLSECTVEDVLCHLGHRTPVMCCQDRYAECVDILSEPQSGTGSLPPSPAREDHTQAEAQHLLTLLGLDSGPISLNKSGILDSLTSQIFLANGSILESDLSGFSPDTWPSADNETLSIFQDFLVILDDPAKFNESLLSGDSTIENILNNIRTNDSDFQIVFDPSQIQFQGADGEILDPEEESILNTIKTQINEAVGNLAKKCANKICIQSLDENFPSTNVTVLSAPGTNKTGGGGMILLEPKTDLALRLQQCQTARVCLPANTTNTGCLFAKARCLQLTGSDRLHPSTRMKLVECRVTALQCAITASSATEQAACSEKFTTCAADLGVDISGNVVINSKKNTDDENKSSEDLSDSNKVGDDDAAETLHSNFGGKNSDEKKNNTDPALTTNPLEIDMKEGAGDESKPIDTESSFSSTLAENQTTDAVFGDEEPSKSSEISQDQRSKDVTEMPTNVDIDSTSMTENKTQVDQFDQGSEPQLGQNNLNENFNKNSTKESNEDTLLINEPLEIVMRAEVVTELNNIVVTATVNPIENSEDTTIRPNIAVPSDDSNEFDNDEESFSSRPIVQNWEVTGSPQKDGNVHQAESEMIDGESKVRNDVQDGVLQTSNNSSSSSSQQDTEAEIPDRGTNSVSETETETRDNQVIDHSQEDTSKTDFNMHLPDLGLSISLKPEETNTDDPMENNTFAMSLPTFGFNVTVDKEPTQCIVGSAVFNDFQEVPSQDPCQLCSCAAGSVQCFTKDCPAPPPGCKRSRLPRQRRARCCPEYNCPGEDSRPTQGDSHDGLEEPLEELTSGENGTPKENPEKDLQESSQPYNNDNDSDQANKKEGGKQSTQPGESDGQKNGTEHSQRGNQDRNKTRGSHSDVLTESEEALITQVKPGPIEKLSGQPLIVLQNDTDLLSLQLDSDNAVSGKDVVIKPEDLTTLATSLQGDVMTMVGVSELPEGIQSEVESADSGVLAGVAGDNKRPTIVINMIGSRKGFWEGDIAQAKDQVRTYVAKRTGLRVFTKDSEEVVGPTYYVELNTTKKEIVDANIHYDTIPLVSLKDKVQIEANIILDLVEEAWTLWAKKEDNMSTTEYETTTLSLARDSLVNSEDDSVIIINIKLLNNGQWTTNSEIVIIDAIKTSIMSQTGVDTRVLVDASKAELDDKIGGLTDFYFLNVTVDGENYIVQHDSVNQLVSGDHGRANIEEIIKSVVEHELGQQESQGYNPIKPEQASNLPALFDEDSTKNNDTSFDIKESGSMKEETMTDEKDSLDDNTIKPSNIRDAAFIELQKKILHNLSDLPGIVLLNEMDLPSLLTDPDTLVIGQDIVIDPDGNVMLSTSLPGDGMKMVEVSDLPEGIQAAVESALAEVLAGSVGEGEAQRPFIVINISGSWEEMDKQEISQAKDHVRTFVAKRSGLRVYTENSEEVVGSVYYVTIMTQGKEVNDIQIFYDTVPIEDLEDGTRIKAKIIQELVKEAWTFAVHNEDNSTTTQDEFTTETSEKGSLMNSEEDSAIIISLTFQNNGIFTTQGEMVLINAIEANVMTETGVKTSVLLDASQQEIEDTLEGLNDFYYLNVTVDNTKNVVRDNSIDQLSTRANARVNLDDIIQSVLENELEQFYEKYKDNRESDGLTELKTNFDSKLLSLIPEDSKEKKPHVTNQVEPEQPTSTITLLIDDSKKDNDAAMAIDSSDQGGRNTTEDNNIATSNIKEANIIQLKQDILDQLSGLPGTVLLNNTDIPMSLLDPETVVIGQDIVIDPEGNVMLTTSLQGDGMTIVGLSDLPDGIQTVVESVLDGFLAEDAGDGQRPAIVINIIGPGKGMGEEELSRAKDRVRNFVSERSGLRVYTEDSDEVVGPAFYVELESNEQEGLKANIFFDTMPLEDLKDGARIKAKKIKDLVIEAWLRHEEPREESTTDVLIGDILRYNEEDNKGTVTALPTNEDISKESSTTAASQIKSEGQMSREELVGVMDKVKDTLLDIFKETTNIFKEINLAASAQETSTTIDRNLETTNKFSELETTTLESSVDREGDLDMSGLQQTNTIQDLPEGIQLPNFNIPKTESIGGGFVQSTEANFVNLEPKVTLNDPEIVGKDQLLEEKPVTTMSGTTINSIIPRVTPKPSDETTVTVVVSQSGAIGQEVESSTYSRNVTSVLMNGEPAEPDKTGTKILEDSFLVLDTTDKQTEEDADTRSDNENLEVNKPGSSIALTSDNSDKNIISGGELSVNPGFKDTQKNYNNHTETVQSVTIGDETTTVKELIETQTNTVDLDIGTTLKEENSEQTTANSFEVIKTNDEQDILGVTEAFISTSSNEDQSQNELTDDLIKIGESSDAVTDKALSKTSEHSNEEENLSLDIALHPVIGEKDIKVFLNFSWADGSLPEDDPDTRNLTGKIMKALNAGVGYLIVPDGEEQEEEVENTVNLVQTILLDQDGNLNINTSIPSQNTKLLTKEDLIYIKEVEQKTTKIILDIFNRMEDNFDVANEDQSSQPASDVVEESMSSTLTSTTNKPYEVADGDSRKPTIVIGLDFEDDNFDPSSLLNGSLATEVEAGVGVKTLVVTKERLGTLAGDNTDVIVQGTVTKDGSVEFDDDQNELDEEGMKNRDKIILAVIDIVGEVVKNIHSKDENSLEAANPVTVKDYQLGETYDDTTSRKNLLAGRPEKESTVPGNDDGDGILKQLQQEILSKISILPGIVLLNNTDLTLLLSDPDTLVIGQDIVIGPEGGVMLSTSSNGDNIEVVGVSDLPERIQAVVESTLAGVLAGGEGGKQGPAIVINISESFESIGEEDISLAKDLVRTFVAERSGLRVYTEDSEEVVGPAYYVELKTKGGEVVEVNIYYDTVPLVDLKEGIRVKAKFIQDLVRKAWMSQKETMEETTSEMLARDDLKNKGTVNQGNVTNPSGDKDPNKVTESPLILVNIRLSESKDIDKSTNILKDNLRAKLEAYTTIKTTALINATSIEVQDILACQKDYFFFQVNVDNKNNINIDESVNRLSAGELDKANIEEIVLTTVKNGLQSESSTTATESDEKEVISLSQTILVNIIIPSSYITARGETLLKKHLKFKLEAETGINTIILVDGTDQQVEEEIAKLNDFYYIPVTVSRTRNVLRNEPIDKLADKIIDKVKLDSIILAATEDELKKIENEVEEIRDASIRVPGSGSQTYTTRPVSGESNDRIIEILANLFIKTLDLSISVKGAMDRSSEQTGKPVDNVEFKIVGTRKKQQVDESLNYFEDVDTPDMSLPEIIKITSSDAMYVNKTKESETALDDGQQPVIIQIVTDDNIRFNVPNGMILEVDLSYLPVSKEAREEEIRSRVRNLIQEITGDGEEESSITSERDALSDAIIKNITQIVMIQMDEALKNKKNSSLLAQGEIADMPLSVPDIMESIFNIITTTATSPIAPTSSPGPIESSPSDPWASLNTTKITVSADNLYPTSTNPALPADTFNSPDSEEVTSLSWPSYPEVVTTASPSGVNKDSKTPASPTIPAISPTIPAQPEQVNNVINNVKKTISEIIKDVLEGANDDTETEDILESIVSRVPAGIKILTADVNGEDLRSQITKSVSTILSEKAANSLRTRGNEQERKDEQAEAAVQLSNSGGSPTSTENTTQPKKRYRTDATTIAPSENGKTTKVPETGTPSTRATPIQPEAITSSSTMTEPTLPPPLLIQYSENEVLDVQEENIKDSPRDVTPLISLFPNIFSPNTKELPEVAVAVTKPPSDATAAESIDEEDTGLVLNLRPRTTTPDPLWALVLTASPEDNDIKSSEVDKINNTSNIIQDGRIFADTSSSGVVKAKVVEDTNFLARSIADRATIGIAAIISIVIGVLALLCFSLMVFLAMARRRRQMEAIGAPSSTGYTSNSRYSPETGNSSTITDMKPTYMEELSPNVSSFDLQRTEVVIPMDGHLTIVGTYEDFLEVPTGARPNLLQTLPVSPMASFTDNSVHRTHEMNDPELAFAPHRRPEFRL